jgi:hypothetical protein
MRANLEETEMKTVEVFELFTFLDGVRYAWVIWVIGDGERRCIAVREVTP